MDPAKPEYFNACVEAQEYASGGTGRYQPLISILVAVFLLNVLALTYFVCHRGWYEDMSEPNNLFSLAINSPPCKELAGSCGGGPHGKQFRSSWKLQNNSGHVFMKTVEQPSEGQASRKRRRTRLNEGLGIIMIPIRQARNRFGERGTL